MVNLCHKFYFMHATMTLGFIILEWWVTKYQYYTRLYYMVIVSFRYSYVYNEFILMFTRGLKPLWEDKCLDHGVDWFDGLCSSNGQTTDMWLDQCNGYAQSTLEQRDGHPSSFIIPVFLQCSFNFIYLVILLKIDKIIKKFIFLQVIDTGWMVH